VGGRAIPRRPPSARSRREHPVVYGGMSIDVHDRRPRGAGAASPQDASALRPDEVEPSSRSRGCAITDRVARRTRTRCSGDAALSAGFAGVEDREEALGSVGLPAAAAGDRDWPGSGGGPASDDPVPGDGTGD